MQRNLRPGDATADRTVHLVYGMLSHTLFLFSSSLYEVNV